MSSFARYQTRALSHSLLARRGGAVMRPALHTPTRHFTDKVLLGSSSALLTCSTTLGLFHLLVTPVSATIGLASLATAVGSGALCFVDGGSASPTTFGALMGLVVGAFGGYYTKSEKEPWRK